MDDLDASSIAGVVALSIFLAGILWLWMRRAYLDDVAYKYRLRTYREGILNDSRPPRTALARIVAHFHPGNIGVAAECQYCGVRLWKEHMIYHDGYGWFCSRTELVEYIKPLVKRLRSGEASYLEKVGYNRFRN